MIDLLFKLFQHFLKTSDDVKCKNGRNRKRTHSDIEEAGAKESLTTPPNTYTLLENSLANCINLLIESEVLENTGMERFHLEFMGIWDNCDAIRQIRQLCRKFVTVYFTTYVSIPQIRKPLNWRNLNTFYVFKAQLQRTALNGLIYIFNPKSTSKRNMQTVKGIAQLAVSILQNYNGKGSQQTDAGSDPCTVNQLVLKALSSIIECNILKSELWKEIRDESVNKNKNTSSRKLPLTQTM